MSYTILGRQIASEWLAFGTFATVGGIASYAATRGGSSKAPAGETKQPPIQADSKEEEDFIKNFIAEAEKEGAGAAH